MITAAFTDGKALICVMPSKRNNGVYLVRVGQEDEELVVRHSCPASNRGIICNHIDKAKNAFDALFWWEPKYPLKTINERIVLQPDWKQVPVPRTVDDWIRVVIRGAS